MTRALTNPSTGIGGRIVLSLFLGAFLGAGLLFTNMMARSYWAGAVTHGWAPVECTVLDSQVVRSSGSDSAPNLSVRYRYRYQDHEYVSTQLSRGMSSSRDAAEIYQLNQRLAAGTRTTCYIDPAHPEEAVLFRPGLWQGIFLLFPLVFVAIGGGGLFFTWRPRPPASATISAKPISAGAADPRRTRLALGLFFTVFLLVGLGVSYSVAVRPLLRILAARNWPTVPCTIVSSRVASHSGSDSTTYSVEVIYRYAVADRSYTAARYAFTGGSSSGYAGKAAVIARLPPGTKTFCYVNPDDATDVVLDRGFNAGLWFGLIPLVFAFIGVAGLRFMVFGGARPGMIGSASTLRNSDAPDPTGAGLSAELRPMQSRGAKLAVFIGIALFWNGIVSVFVYHVVADWQRGRHQWFLAVFLLPFVTIGLFLIGGAVRQALALSNPRPRLRVIPSRVPLGKTVEVGWEMEGKVEALRGLRIFLEGREEATYRRGTHTSTDKHVFATLELVKTTEPAMMRAGAARLTVPADSMHSWASGNNRIIWVLRVSGDIPRWPDIDEEFPFTVLPHASA